MSTACSQRDSNPPCPDFKSSASAAGLWEQVDAPCAEFSSATMLGCDIRAPPEPERVLMSAR
jgi:hypothetical protein